MKISKGTAQVLVLGLVALTGASYFLARNVVTVTQGTRVTAKVLDVETVSSPGSGSSRTYRPTVKFTREDGEEVTLTTGYSSSTFKFTVGDEVPVYYKTANPSEFRIATFLSMWAAPLAGLILAAFILYGAFSLYRSESSKSS